MRRSILFSVIAPKRKAADVEENEKYFTWTDEEVSLLLQIANAYKIKKNKRRKVFGIDQITLQRYSEIIL